MKKSFLCIAVVVMVLCSQMVFGDLSLTDSTPPTSSSPDAGATNGQIRPSNEEATACSQKELTSKAKKITSNFAGTVQEMGLNMQDCNANDACKAAAAKFEQDYTKNSRNCQGANRQSCLQTAANTAVEAGKTTGNQMIRESKAGLSPLQNGNRGSEMTVQQGASCLKEWAKKAKSKDAIKQMAPDQVAQLNPGELTELRRNNGDALTPQQKAVLKGNQIVGYLSGAPSGSQTGLVGFDQKELAGATQLLNQANRYPPVSSPGRPGASAGPGWEELIKMSPEAQAAAVQQMTPEQRAEYYQFKNAYNADRGLELQKAGQEQQAAQQAAQMAMGLAEKLMGMAGKDSPSSQSGGAGVTESPKGIQAEDTKALLNPYALPPESLVQSTPDCNKVQAGSALAETCKGLLAFTPNGAVKASEQVKILNGGSSNIATQVNNQDASLGPGSDLLVAAAPLVSAALGLTAGAVVGSRVSTPLIQDTVSEDVVIGDFNSITNTRYPIKSTADRPVLYHAWTTSVLKGPPEWPKYQKRGLPRINLNYFRGSPPPGDQANLNFGQLARDFWRISSSVPDARVDLKARSSFTTVLFKDGIPKGSSNMAHAWNTEAVTWNKYIVEGKGYEFVVSGGAVRKPKGNRIIASMFGIPPSTLSRQQKELVYSPT